MCELGYCRVSAYAALLAAAADLRVCHHPHHKQHHLLVAEEKGGNFFGFFCLLGSDPVSLLLQVTTKGAVFTMAS